MSQPLLRRDILAAGGLFGVGALAHASFAAAAPAQATTRPSPEARVRELGIQLPPAPRPMANYVTRVRVGDLLFTSGHGPGAARGKVGRDLDVAAGKAAARDTGLQILSTVRDELGSLDRVVRVVRIFGMVNATEDFTDHPQVINGCSDLLVEVFGEQTGKGARCAVGMVSLPAGIPVEIEILFQVA